MKTLKEFVDSIIIEALHPELHAIVTSHTNKKGTSKKTLLSKTIKKIVASGEKTGIEGNMPSGSSRAYLQHEEPHSIEIDGKPAKIKTGMKVAIKASLDKHHDHEAHNGMSLGQMQNHAESGDWYVNAHHRVLSEENGKFHTNEDGIFPPLIEHDHDHHEWSHVGHAEKITKKGFRTLTKTESHPEGITHYDFCDTLMRFHRKSNGNYWPDKERETQLDHIEKHPLVQKFLNYHGNTGNTPADLQQIQNMGVWTHPHTNKKYIVARDSGFSNNVDAAYTHARRKSYERFR